MYGKEKWMGKSDFYFTKTENESRGRKFDQNFMKNPILIIDFKDI